MRNNWDGWRARIDAAATRARQAMAFGATLDDVLRSFRTRHQLETLDVEAALRRIASREMDPHTAELIVRNSIVRSYAHITLADLELLGDTPDVGDGDVDGSTRYHRDEAIIDRKPFLLYARGGVTMNAVDIYASNVPLDAPPAVWTHAINGELVTFEGVCKNVRRSVAAWPSEFRILRDEPYQLLLHILRAPSNNPKA